MMVVMMRSTYPSGLPLLANFASLLMDLEYVSSMAALINTHTHSNVSHMYDSRYASEQ